MKETESAHCENMKAKSKLFFVNTKLFSVNAIFQVIAKNQHVKYYTSK